MLRYAHFRELGYPIGSGATESANKVVVEERLKGAGMHWAVEQLNPMLALRNLSANQCWESGWGSIKNQWLKEKQEQRQRRGLERKARKVAAQAELEKNRAYASTVEVISPAAIAAAVDEAKTNSGGEARSKEPYKPAASRRMVIGRAKYQINPNFINAKT